MSLPISGFTAVPNPQMLAFMAAQSFVMMMQAGEGWQYGKRKQSAMTNEEFNKQTVQSIMQRQMSELKQAIPTIEQSMNAMTPMIRTIVIQYGDFMKEIIRALPAALTAAQGGQTLTGNISTVGKEFSDILKSIIPTIPEASAQSNLPDTLQQHINIQKDLKSDTSSFTAPTAKPPIPDRPPQITIPKQSADQSAYIAWEANASAIRILYLQSKKNMADLITRRKSISPRQMGNNITQWSRQQKAANLAASKLKTLSNDYRNPNNKIRNAALLLRQQISNGQWKKL